MKKQDGHAYTKMLKTIIILLVIINVAVIAIKFSNAQKESDQTKTYYTGDILKPNHSANLVDYAYEKQNIVISPININTSINKLYNMNISNDEIEEYTKKTLEESNEFEKQLEIIKDNKELTKLEKYYISLMEELNKYTNYNVSDISSLKKDNKQKLILLLNQINAANEAIVNNEEVSVNYIKKYVLTEEQSKINDYAIYDLLIECLDEFETYSYKTNINNYSELFYNSDLLIKSKKRKKQKYPSIDNVSLNGQSYENKKETTQSINNKIKQETNNNVKYIIDESDIDNNNLYFLNTYNFESVWKENFDKEYISGTEFTTFNNQIEIVESLYENVDYYLENDYAKGFVKEFKDNKYSFVGILPNETKDFKLSNLNIEELLKNKVNLETSISIPKFSFQYDVNLGKLYNDIGIEYNSKIQLDNLTEEVSLNYMISKTSITIDEKGTNSSKVRSTEHESKELHESTNKIYLNRPFAFLIIDNETGNVLLIGKVLNPNQK